MSEEINSRSQKFNLREKEGEGTVVLWSVEVSLHTSMYLGYKNTQFSEQQ